MELVDTHCHLDGYLPGGELPGVLARARAAGVARLVAVGTGPEDWSLYRDLARVHAGQVYYSVGLHPCHVGDGWADQVRLMEAYWTPSGSAGSVDQRGAAGPTQAGEVPVALGECGLDRFHLSKDPAEAEKVYAWQKEAFAFQLGVAKKLGCPLIVHSRGAFADSVRMIDASGVDWGRVVFHCFVEGEAEVAQLRERGGWASFTGIVTYKNAETVRAAAKAQGLERFMVETDAPYLAPVPHRGKTNEPAWVRHVAEYAAAEVFRVPLEELAAVSTANAERLFGLGRR